jgi:hypothetical protein
MERLMNTEMIIHPKLQHFGLTTSNMDEMLDWYRKVLGMTLNHGESSGWGPLLAPLTNSLIMAS